MTSMNKTTVMPAIAVIVLLLTIGGPLPTAGFAQGIPALSAPAPTVESSLNLAVAAVTEHLSDCDPDVRWAAVVSLREMGGRAKGAIPALARLLGDADGFIAVDAAHTLEDLGADATPSLLPALSDPQPRVRELAARTLAAIGAPAKAAVPALMACLCDGDPRVRLAAVAALHQMGVDAKPAIPLMARLLRDPDDIVRIDGSHALVSLGPDAVASVAGLLHDPDARVRELVVRTLEQITAAEVSIGSSPAPPAPSP